jgi:FKBP-type peptidyl-prolyl cis-trans isomerase FklB
MWAPSLPILSTLFISLAVASNDFGVKFLEHNKKNEGVVTLPSGLQYKVIRAGAGADHPTPDSPCECHYEGRTAQKFAEDPTSSSNTFDGSYARGSPTTFAPNQVIKGWTEGSYRARMSYVSA